MVRCGEPASWRTPLPPLHKSTTPTSFPTPFAKRAQLVLRCVVAKTIAAWSSSPVEPARALFRMATLRARQRLSSTLTGYSPTSSCKDVPSTSSLAGARAPAVRSSKNALDELLFSRPFAICGSKGRAGTPAGRAGPPRSIRSGERNARQVALACRFSPSPRSHSRSCSIAHFLRPALSTTSPPFWPNIHRRSLRPAGPRRPSWAPTVFDFVASTCPS